MEEPELQNIELRLRSKVSKPSAKEREQMFKLAFRNYIDLIGLADRKAGLLIQVNSIVATVSYGFLIKPTNSNYVEYIPTSLILISSITTIFFSVLASKPRANNFSDKHITEKEEFFFGSYDRLDPYFKNVSWEKYSDDMTEFFRGDKKNVFEELLKESFSVRKVLSKKFTYLSVAYTVFFNGLLLGLLIFLLLFIYR